MIKLEQILIWLGVASLAWMIIFLSAGDQLAPALVEASTGKGVGPYVVAAMFLAGRVRITKGKYRHFVAGRLKLRFARGQSETRRDGVAEPALAMPAQSMARNAFTAISLIELV